MRICKFGFGKRNWPFLSAILLLLLALALAPKWTERTNQPNKMSKCYANASLAYVCFFPHQMPSAAIFNATLAIVGFPTPN
jgi:hypothetical protein